MGNSNSKPSAALSQPGPHGLPMRFVVRRGGRHLKLCGADLKNPLHYINRHRAAFARNETLTLHTSGHRKDNSPALLSIKKGVLDLAPVGGKSSILRLPNFEGYQIALHRADALDNLVEMRYEGRQGLTREKYVFTLVCPGGRRETFRWYESDKLNCHEVRAIHKRDKPVVKTGMAKEGKKKRIGMLVTGGILVRVTEGAPKCQGDPSRVFGWDEKGREIVASYAKGGSGWIGGEQMYFQFWGSAAQGAFGQDFTRIAAMSGTARWREQIAEEKAAAQRRARQR